MMIQRLRRQLSSLIITAAALTTAGMVSAEDAGFQVIDEPGLSKSSIHGSVGVSRELPADANHGTYARTTSEVNAGGIVWTNHSTELQLTAAERLSRLQTDEVFPDGYRLPNHMQEWKSGLVARHLRSDGKMIGMTGSVGSWDDHPLSGKSHRIIDVGMFTRLPTNTGNAWILNFTYSNERAIANGVPIPGVEYAWRIHSNLHALIGFPIEMLNWRPGPRSSADIFISGLGTIHAGGSYAPIEDFEPLHIRCGIDFGGDRFRPDNLPDSKALIYFRALTYSIGAELRKGPIAGLSLSIGYATHREIIEGHSFLSADNHIDVRSGVVGKMSMNAQF